MPKLKDIRVEFASNGAIIYVAREPEKPAKKDEPVPYIEPERVVIEGNNAAILQKVAEIIEG